MKIQCPACGKQTETGIVDACARCGCNLSVLAGIRAAAASQLSQAQTELRQGAWAEALAHAERSWQLVHTSHSAHAACLATVAMGDTIRLARWRRRAGGPAKA
jgi:hypothetical protein